MQNPGNVPSEPIITVTGSGEITLIVDMTNCGAFRCER